MTKTESLGTVLLSIARLAIDLLVGSIALQRRIQRTMTSAAVVTLLVPHRRARQLLLGSEHSALAAGTARTLRC